MMKTIVSIFVCLLPLISRGADVRIDYKKVIVTPAAVRVLGFDKESVQIKVAEKKVTINRSELIKSARLVVGSEIYLSLEKWEAFLRQQKLPYLDVTSNCQISEHAKQVQKKLILPFFRSLDCRGVSFPELVKYQTFDCNKETCSIFISKELKI